MLKCRHSCSVDNQEAGPAGRNARSCREAATLCSKKLSLRRVAQPGLARAQTLRKRKSARVTHDAPVQPLCRQIECHTERGSTRRISTSAAVSGEPAQLTSGGAPTSTLLELRHSRQGIACQVLLPAPAAIASTLSYSRKRTASVRLNVLCVCMPCSRIGPNHMPKFAMIGAGKHQI